MTFKRGDIVTANGCAYPGVGAVKFLCRVIKIHELHSIPEYKLSLIKILEGKVMYIPGQTLYFMEDELVLYDISNKALDMFGDILREI